MSEKLTAVKSPESSSPAVSSANPTAASPFAWSDRFVQRHIGPGTSEVSEMLKLCGFSSLDAMIDATVPSRIRFKKPLNLPPSRSEHGLLIELKAIASKNRVFRSINK